MKKRINTKIKFAFLSILMVLGICLESCEKYLDIPLPVDRIAGDALFLTDNSTSSFVSGNLGSLYTGFQGGAIVTGTAGVAFLTGLYSDELQPIDLNNLKNVAYYKNILQTSDVTTWADIYKQIYSVNLAIEGIRGSKAQLLNRSQWLGESLVTRAFLYFNLVTLFGDVPLTTTSDFNHNNVIARSPSAEVYAQIVKDLIEAQSLLSNDYKDGSGNTTADRGRPNKFAATALLSKVYLYQKDWSNAEIQANAVLNNSNYQLAPVSSTFVTTSKETIWAVAAVTGFISTNDYISYNGGMPASTPFPSVFVPVAMSTSLASSFEQGDLRFSNWIRQTTVPAQPANGSTPASPALTYYFPNKYKTPAPPFDYAVVLRLADLYLIRAEARANLSNPTGSKTDIDIIRSRAGLAGTTANSKDALLDAVIKERRNEFFSENGNRFFDLKRTGKIDGVMAAESSIKGGFWNPSKALWPIPSGDILINPNLTQNPGY